jgi:hypothetical protein
MITGHPHCVGLNQANTADRVPDDPLDRLDLQVCICRWIGIRIRCIALAPLEAVSRPVAVI